MKAINPEEYIYSFALFGRKGGYKPGLARMKYLLEKVGNPHECFPIIHIGGSNGKGSTSAFLDYVLAEKQLKVGRFTSPHLSYYGERMMVNNQAIKEKDLIALLEELKPLIDGVEVKTDYGRPSFFEVTTFLALCYFQRQNIELGIIEVGLGGLRDATNIVQPLVSGITNISLEHTKQLGHTLEEIAKQKAGIIKRGVPIVTGAQGVALEVIRQEAKAKGAPFISLEESSHWQRKEHSLKEQKFSLRTAKNFYEELTIKMLGQHQIANAALAVNMLENLPETFGINEEVVRRGLAKTFWPGRLELWPSEPMIILDGAHNPGGFSSLVEYLKEEYKEKKIVFVLSFLNDKDTKPFLPLLESLADRIIFAQINNFRAASPDVILKEFSSLAMPMETASSIKEALELAMIQAGPEGLVCLTGSLYAVGEAREVLNKLFPKE